MKGIMSILGIKTKETIVNWSKLIRDKMSEHSKMNILGGEGTVVQVDEALFQGRRKNNVGRLLLGNKNHTNPLENSRFHNFDKRAQGPWVLGLVEKEGRKVKCFML